MYLFGNAVCRVALGSTPRFTEQREVTRQNGARLRVELVRFYTGERVTGTGCENGVSTVEATVRQDTTGVSGKHRQHGG
jgi:hypothetical protein